jgi:hypothetical protein
MFHNQNKRTFYVSMLAKYADFIINNCHFRLFLGTENNCFPDWMENRSRERLRLVD